MYAFQTYSDRLRNAEETRLRDTKGWGSMHRAYALGVLSVGAVASYQLKDLNLAIAAAILVSMWALIFQLIATTKLIHKSLMMLQASPEQQPRGFAPDMG